ncbi:MAG TPA: hypothetical protein ENJ95_15485 [Bacteroidetes bacterium]|nr:hypothetical protein [Bacteroidota bacterium]
MKAQFTPFSKYIRISLTGIISFLFSIASFAEIAIINTQCICSGRTGSINLRAEPDQGMLSAGPFTFAWTGPNGFTSEEEDLSNLTDVGIYQVIVTNAYGCAVTLSTNLTECSLQPQDIQITPHNSCDNAPTGTIEATAGPNLTGPFTFTWSGTDPVPPPTAEDLTNGYSRVEGLEPGEYCVSITSPDGCIEICDIVIDESIGAPYIAPNTAACICPGGYGIIDIDVISGSGNYGFAWTAEFPGPFIPANPIQNTSVEDAVIYFPGTYHVLVRDLGTGCSETFTFQVGECEFDIQNFNQQISPSCQGANGGTYSLQITEEQGIAPFFIKWDMIGGPSETFVTDDGNFLVENLEPGEYCITVLSHNGCSTETCNIIIEELEEPEIDLVVIPASFGGGEIEIEVSGTNGPYGFLWSNGYTGSSQAGLPEGDYSITVTDAGNCEYTVSTSFLTCDNLASALSNLEADVTPMTGPEGENPGSIDILNLSDVYSGYNLSYLWNNGAQTEDIYNLSPGNYCIDVTLPQECAGIDPPQLQCWEICGFTIDFSIDPINCYRAYLGVAAYPSSPSYTYEWNIGVTGQQTITAFYGAEYCVTVTDGNGCTGSVCTELEPEPLSLEAVVTNATFGNPDGSVTVTAQGGIPPYVSFEWGKNGDENFYGTGETISGLLPGIYTVTVTDDCGETATLVVEVECEFGTQDFAAKITGVDCSVGSFGEIKVYQFPQGASGPFDFQWDNGMTGQYITGLAGGEYCTTVTDMSSECFSVLCYTVPAEGDAGLSIGFDVTSTCLGGNSGELTAIPSPETNGPFDYAWTNVITYEPAGNTATVTDLPIGWYSVRVTDVRGCTSQAYTSINSASQFSISATAEPNPFWPGENVHAEVAVTSTAQPTEPVTYTWTNASGFPSETITNDPYLDGLGADIWNVLATDASGCSAYTFFQVTMNQCPEITASGFKSKKPSGCNKPDGTIYPSNCCFEVEGGAGPYSYLWSNGGTTAGISNLSDGTYTLTITDANGCTGIYTHELTTENSVHVIVDQEGATGACQGQNNGRAWILIWGGSAPYTVNWGNGQIETVSEGEAENENLSGGEYCVIVTNSEGCSTEECFFIPTLESDPNFDFEEVKIIKACSYSTGGGMLVRVNGSNVPFTYRLLDGETFEVIDENSSGWFNGIRPGSSNPYCVEVVDHCGQTIRKCDYTIPYNPAIYLSGEVTDVCNTADGSIDLSVEGGTPPYTYSWGSQDKYGLSPGEYCVTVRDVSQCTNSICFTVEKKVTLNILSIDHATNQNSQDGSISIEAIGGIEPYSYQWQGAYGYNSTNQNAEGLRPGYYSVTVTDAEGCTASVEDIWLRNCEDVSEGFDIQYYVIKASGENNADGSIYLWLNPDGGAGSGNFSVQWTGPNGFSSNSSVITDLLPGTYSVVVSDGCKLWKKDFKIEICNDIEIEYDVKDDCAAQGLGRIVITNVTGGNGEPYYYVWLDPDLNIIGYNDYIAGISGGTYTVLVDDGDGCVGTFEIEVSNGSFGQVFREEGIYPITMFDPQLGQPYYYPAYCVTNWFCNGDYILSTNLVQTDINYGAISEGTCQIDIYCGNSEMPFRTVFGNLENTSSYKNGLCYIGKHCVYRDFLNPNDALQTLIRIPLIEVGFPPQVQDACRDIEPETLPNIPPEECVRIYSCSGQEVRIEKTANTCCFGPQSCCPGYCSVTSNDGCEILAFTGDGDDKRYIDPIKEKKKLRVIESLSKRGKIATGFEGNLTSALFDTIFIRKNMTGIKRPSTKDAGNLETEAVVEMKVYPNPFDHTITIKVYSKQVGEGSINLNNMLGKTFKEEDVHFEKGQNSFTFDFGESLPFGVYILEAVLPDKESFSEKVMHMSE